MSLLVLKRRSARVFEHSVDISKIVFACEMRRGALVVLWFIASGTPCDTQVRFLWGIIFSPGLFIRDTIYDQDIVEALFEFDSVPVKQKGRDELDAAGRKTFESPLSLT